MSAPVLAFTNNKSSAQPPKKMTLEEKIVQLRLRLPWTIRTIEQLVDRLLEDA